MGDQMVLGSLRKLIEPLHRILFRPFFDDAAAEIASYAAACGLIPETL